MSLSDGRTCNFFSEISIKVRCACANNRRKIIIKEIIYALVINTVVCPIAMDDIIIKIKDPSCDELIYKGILY